MAWRIWECGAPDRLTIQGVERRQILVISQDAIEPVAVFNGFINVVASPIGHTKDSAEYDSGSIYAANGVCEVWGVDDELALETHMTSHGLHWPTSSV